MRLRETFIAASMALILANCANMPNVGNVGNFQFCQERPWICAAIGVVVVGGIVWIATDSSDNHDSSSDVRLKQDIQQVDVLPNGLNLYAFRFRNDDRVFVSVLAQEVLADPRYAHAVSVGENGYYKVDLSEIGVHFVGDAEAFKEASENAMRGL